MAANVYYAASSLDGYIADLEENLEWLTDLTFPGAFVTGFHLRGFRSSKSAGIGAATGSPRRAAPAGSGTVTS